MTSEETKYDAKYDALIEDTTSRCFRFPCDTRPLVLAAKEHWLFFKLLMWKNMLMFKRNNKSTIFQVLVPVFICVYLVVVQKIADSAINYTDKNRPVYEVDDVQLCWGDGCITLGVSMSAGENEWTSYVLQYLANNYDLKMGKDIKIIEGGPVDFIHYLSKHENKTQTGVIFCTGSFSIPDNPYTRVFPCPESPSSYSYSLVINSTLIPSLFLSQPGIAYPMDYASVSMKLAIDKAIFSYEAKIKGGSAPYIEVDVQEYPVVSSRYTQGYDVVTTSGAFYFFIPPMVTFVVMLTEIVREKEYRLRQGLAVMGMSASAYWQSWFCTGLVFVLLTSNTLIAAGNMCQIQFFLNTEYSALFILFGSFALAMMLVAFFVSTLLKTTKAAYTWSYAFILVGLVLQFLLSDVRIVYYMYSTHAPDWVVTVRTLLAFYPPFNFSKAFGDIAETASSHYNEKKALWAGGDHYSWNRFVSSISGEIDGTTYDIYSAFVSCMICLGNAGMFGVLTWFFDHIIESNRGSSDPLYFMFTRRFWGCSARPNSVSQDDTTEEDGVVADEKQRVLTSEREGEKSEGLRIVGLSKVFRKHSCGITSKKDIYAVNNVFLEGLPDELITLLGHNGAGKSTLIGMLTGIVSPTEGYAEICGFNIIDQIDEARKVLGVCPQHDILWDELTAREHLRLYGRLKGLSGPELEAEINEKLADVKLTEVAEFAAGTYSGGMKRRLSVAISGIGNPKVIIMDEPTTGMDPINRREVWKLIQKLKKGRVVILTTHSMEEADVLSDRIAVIVGGSIKCMGSALYLKNNFGDGYRISIVTSEPQKVIRKLFRLIPTSKIIDESGGSLILAVHDTDELKLFVEMMEGNDHRSHELRSSIIDWGLSNTTLEEVFMRVTGMRSHRHDEAESVEMMSPAISS